VRSWDTCQRHKQSNKKLYGKVPLVSALRDKESWESIHVDCIGPFKIQVEDTNKRAHILEIHCLTMVDSCTNWSEATPLLNHSAKHAAKKFDKAWLCSKPHPLQVVHDNGIEFIGGEFQEMLSSYNIEPKCTTVKNPTANALVECLHSTLEDQL
jgi:transposase InsO family protein